MSDAPVSASHVVVNVAAVVAALLASAGGSPLAAVGDGVLARVAFVLLVGCCAWLVAIVLDSLPALNALRAGRRRPMTALVVIETVVLVLLTVVVIGLLRSHGEILRQLHTLGAGLDPDARESAGVAAAARRPAA